jgi:Zn-dependent protease
MEIDLSAGIIWYVVLTYSTVLHEAAHAWSAKRMGDYTAYLGGQVTLDPIPHIRREPIGMVLLPIVSYLMNGWMIGWASAPYDPHWALKYPKRSAIMAMAGPAANLLLTIVAGVLMIVGARFGVFVEAPDGPNTLVYYLSHVVTSNSGPFWQGCATVLSIMFSLNLLLCIFNLMPLPPLDGSAIPLFFLDGSRAEAYQHMIWQPMMQVFGFLVAWNGFIVVARHIYWPLMQWFVLQI